MLLACCRYMYIYQRWWGWRWKLEVRWTCVIYTDLGMWYSMQLFKHQKHNFSVTLYSLKSGCVFYVEIHHDQTIQHKCKLLLWPQLGMPLPSGMSWYTILSIKKSILSHVHTCRCEPLGEYEELVRVGGINNKGAIWRYLREAKLSHIKWGNN